MPLAPEYRCPAALPVPNPCDMSPLDIAASTLFGREPRPPLERLAPGRSLSDVLDELIEEQLATGKTFVAFSGGRDSSIALAMAVDAARRLGHPEPVPLTMRYTGVPNPDGVRMQELVISHLGLSDWERIQIDDELEYVGPYARRAVQEFGITFPTTSYLLLPLLDQARGGTLGFSASHDDFYDYWHWSRISDVLARRRRPNRRELPYLALAAAPQPARARVMRKQLAGTRMTWLTPEADDEALRQLVDEASRIPVRADRAIERQYTHRCYLGSRVALEGMAQISGADLYTPLWDPRFMAASVADAGKWGTGDRTAAVLRGVAATKLPREVLERAEDGPSRDVMFGPRTREWVREWDGSASPGSDLVDLEALRETWSAERVDSRTRALLLLAAHHDRAAVATNS